MSFQPQGMTCRRRAPATTATEERLVRIAKPKTLLYAQCGVKVRHPRNARTGRFTLPKRLSLTFSPPDRSRSPPILAPYQWLMNLPYRGYDSVLAIYCIDEDSLSLARYEDEVLEIQCLGIKSIYLGNALHNVISPARSYLPILDPHRVLFIVLCGHRCASCRIITYHRREARAFRQYSVGVLA